MKTVILYIGAIIVGLSLGLQSPMNSALGKIAISHFLINFIIITANIIFAKNSTTIKAVEIIGINS
ncbi:MAG: hypothetical protein PWQ59_321 [Thermoanaerobacterium sp.]|jgi:hypothetical protein|uniref:hypothetical protein n=1 Tax=Thermoanaerobacterium thermosaccharolyticum TaxID=1517 RepID=UPI0024AC5AB7|nr:hypothetical protein [Thermoanaerobacterium sp.]MDK2805786.1 hypothetical protein [Thermoanaerobacterium sp.]MDN5316266.1 hypothetical protein [Thermoanaerobacterium sp.]WHE07108.1 hypothetical protein PGH24_13425 [Thermoanaerobacterium thermosaccharolyticum]